MKTGRPPTSRHGKLFGGDSLYEVLAALASSRGKRFSVLPIDDEDEIVPLARTIGRTVTQTRREVRKLQNIGVLKRVEKRRRAEVYAVTNSKLANAALALPGLLEREIGGYARRMG